MVGLVAEEGMGEEAGCSQKTEGAVSGAGLMVRRSCHGQDALSGLGALTAFVKH